MTEKIHSDYISIKEFTENAAHEMQTPLAVVQSKLELLLQDENLKEAQSDLIVQATEGLSRLNKLNQSLLLLAKIDNNQYATGEVISLAEIIKKYLKLFDSFIREKEITVEENYGGDWLLNLHPLLADSLVSNLLGNAVKYNYKGGKISISLTNKIFEIANTSQLPSIDPQQLFKRFYKSKFDGHSSTGLGLAIVKKICDTHHLNITYIPV
jgi:signal transduction histidine kinase